ncbi:MAG TPA: hypothetical protein VHV79_05385 [Mycobacteriales bacterium]|nr:hypothetical protein [Mycobacteriales bacterium]
MARQHRMSASDSDWQAESHPEHVYRSTLESGDDVVQLLCIAKYALTAGEPARAMSAIDAALEIARHSLSDLLVATGAPQGSSHAGGMVRSIASGSSSSERPTPVVPRPHPGPDRS